MDWNIEHLLKHRQKLRKSLRGLVAFAVAILVGLSSEAATFNVGTLSALQTRINAANPGDQIILSNGVYVSTNYISVTRSGTATSPIVISAQSIGGAQIVGAPGAAGTSGFNLNGCDWVVIQGFYFTHTNDLNVDDYFRVESGSSHCRITRNVFEFDPVQYWCYVKGDDAEIDHNLFRNKVQKGEYITLDGNYPDIGQRLWVHDNHFYNNQYTGGNGGENIRLGVGTYQLISSWAVVENNLFEKADGDAEAISVKSSDCVVRYNTLTNSTGQISLRSQTRGRVEGNFMLNSSGIRFYGDDDLIFNNYLQGSDGIVFGSGEAPQISDGYLAANAGVHAAANRARVVFNTLVNCSAYFDEDVRGYYPSDMIVANNLLQGSSGAFVSTDAATGQISFTWLSNIFWGAASYVGSPTNGYQHVNPQLPTNTATPFHIAVNSPATNASYAAAGEVAYDMDGQLRVGVPDIGADEYSTLAVARRPMNTNDVGAYLATTNFGLVAMPWSQTVMPGRGTTFTNSISSHNRFTNTVALSVTNLPPGASASFNNGSFTNGYGVSTLTVTTSNTTPPGRYTILITGIGTGFTNTTTACLNVGSIPAGWTDLDLNNPGVTGSADYFMNTLFVKGGGSAISGTSDNFHFLYQTLTNGATITARVVTQPATATTAKSGVMIRETTNANSKFVSVVLQPGSVRLETRASTGGTAVTRATFSGGASPVGTNSPCWVRLTRSGDTFTGYASTNGVDWLQLGVTNVVMTNAQTGLAVSSGSTTKLATTTFDNVDVSLPPGSLFDLSHWKLQLPIDTSGALSGTNLGVQEILSPQLVAGYASDYFYSGADGEMTFWSPVTGATTGGTEYPRSELREMLNPNDASVDWTGQGVHTLSATCQVLQVPSSGKVCIGQIKEYTGLSLPLVFMLYDNGTIFGRVKMVSTNDASNYTFTYANVGLSNNISYQVKMVNGLISIAVNGVTNSFDVYQTDPAWATNTLYFKAGDYCQDNAGNDLEGARVAFSSLSVTHAPSITNQPASSAVSAGDNTSFTVGATDWTNMTYQWYFNSASIAGKTNATLNITNVSAANIGNYFVVVSDSLGSLTSSVVILTTNSPPGITSQPASQNVLRGSTATVSVGVFGNAPLSYQWFFNGTTPVGSNSNFISIANMQAANAGNYSVIVTNAFGAVTSSVATLTLVVNSTNTFLNEQWLDGTRTDTSLPSESAWYASSASSLTAKTNSLVGTPDSSSTMTWWTYFTSNSASAIPLTVSDTLRLTLAFTTSGVNVSNNSKGLRLGLYNSSGGTRTITDGSNPAGNGHTGFMANINFGQTFGSGIQFLERTNLGSSSLIATTADYNSDSSLISSVGGPAAGDSGFSNNVPYILQMLVTRNASSLDLTATFSDANGWSETVTGTWSDTNYLTTAFDTFVFRPALQSLTSTNFTFTQFKVETVATDNRPPVPASHLVITNKNRIVVLAATNLLATDTDPDGDALDITAVSATSTNGGAVTFASGAITYTSPTNYVGADLIGYTVTDARGAASTGYINVTMIGAPVLNTLSLAANHSSLTALGSGVSNQPYVLQAATNIATPISWTRIATNIAGANGSFIFTNLLAPSNKQQFFRVLSP